MTGRNIQYWKSLSIMIWWCMVMMKWVDIPQTGSGASLDMRSDKRDGADNYKVSALHWMSSERINNQMTTADWTGTHLSDCLSLSPFFPVSLYVFAFIPLFPTSIRFPSPSTALSMEKEAHARKKNKIKRRKTSNGDRKSRAGGTGETSAADTKQTTTREKKGIQDTGIGF